MEYHPQLKPAAARTQNGASRLPDRGCWASDNFGDFLQYRQARETFRGLVERASIEPAPARGSSMLVLGDFDFGRAHLLRAMRRQVHQRDSGVFSFVPVTSDLDRHGRQLLKSVVTSLDEPVAAGEGAKTTLTRMSEAVVADLTSDERSLLSEFRATADEDESRRLANRISTRLYLKSTRFQEIDPDLIKALLFLHKGDPAIRGLVRRFLSCEVLGRLDRRALGDVVPRLGDDQPLATVAEIGKLVWVLFSAPFIVALDQSEEDVMSHGFRRALRWMQDVTERVRTSITVFGARDEAYREVRGDLPTSLVEDLERDPLPIYLDDVPRDEEYEEVELEEIVDEPPQVAPANRLDQRLENLELVRNRLALLNRAFAEKQNKAAIRLSDTKLREIADRIEDGGDGAESAAQAAVFPRVGPETNGNGSENGHARNGSENGRARNGSENGHARNGDSRTYAEFKSVDDELQPATDAVADDASPSADDFEMISPDQVHVESGGGEGEELEPEEGMDPTGAEAEQAETQPTTSIEAPVAQAPVALQHSSNGVSAVQPSCDVPVSRWEAPDLNSSDGDAVAPESPTFTAADEFEDVSGFSFGPISIPLASIDVAPEGDPEVESMAQTQPSAPPVVESADESSGHSAQESESVAIDPSAETAVDADAESEAAVEATPVASDADVEADEAVLEVEAAQEVIEDEAEAETEPEAEAEMETEVATPEVEEVEVAEPEVAEPEVAETEVAETEVAESEVAEVEVAEVEVTETEVAEVAIEPTAEVESAPPAPVRSRAVIKLQDEWTAYRKKSRVRPPAAESGRLDAIEWALQSCARELPRDLAITVERDGADLWVNIEREGLLEQILVALCDEPLANGVLLRRVRRIEKCGATRIVMLRSEPYPEGSNRTVAALADCDAAGWGRYELQGDEFKHMKVLRAFIESLGKRSALDRWMAAERPLLSLEFLADVFQSAERIESWSDVESASARSEEMSAAASA